MNPQTEALLSLLWQSKKCLRLNAPEPMHNNEAHLLQLISDAQAENAYIGISTLSRRLHVSQPSVTQAVQNLVEKGYVERKEVPGDRRAICLRLTQEGQAAYAHAQSRMRQTLSAYLNALGETDAQHLIRILEKTLAYTEAAATNPKKHSMKEGDA